jgi:SAM-dependent methyltransferase
VRADFEGALLAGLRVSQYDLPTRDKIPIIREFMAAPPSGRALDVGIGTGFTTYSVFGDRFTACVDIDIRNLAAYRSKFVCAHRVSATACVVALANALPFKDGAFQHVLCSEVLEHLEDDRGAAAEIARVLTPEGRAVITVPYAGLRFTSFLGALGISTVHDQPGPEQHVRPGYDEASLDALCAASGLEVERSGFYLRLFSRLATDLVSVAHLVYERLRYRRRAWTWADVVATEGSAAFRLYTFLFPAFLAMSRLDAFLGRFRGFGLVVSLRRKNR